MQSPQEQSTNETGTPAGVPRAEPDRVVQTVVVRPGGSSPEGEPLVELRPRVVGPGRLERQYQGRIADLEQGLSGADQASDGLRAELATARLIERGTGRFADRLEERLEARREELAEVRAQGHRLMVALGALQQENSSLRAELDLARTKLAGLPVAPRSRWRRLLGL
jgi:hypothetical protein